MHGSISRKRGATRGLEKNLVLFPWFHGLQMLSFIGPIIVVFFLANNLTYAQIFLLEAIYGIVIMACELPTGMFADKYGRVKSLIISTILILTGVLVYARGHSFLEFLIAETIWGIGISFSSGAEEALLYDTLKDLRRSGEYKRIMGKTMTIFYGCGIVSSLIGGIMGQKDLRLPFYLAAGTFTVMLVLATQFTEPSYHKSVLGHLAHILKALKHVWHKTKVRWLVFYQATLISALLIMFWLIQPYFTLLDIPLSLFGVYFAGFFLLGLISARYAHQIERFLGIRKSLFFMAAILVIGFAVLGFVPAILSTIWFFLMEGVWGYSIPVMGDYLNRLVTSQQRATVLSIGSFGTRLVFAVLGPLFGKLADRQGVPFTLVSIAAAYLVLFLFLWFTFRTQHETG